VVAGATTTAKPSAKLRETNPGLEVARRPK
jgi:hypothetical protein